MSGAGLMFVDALDARGTQHCETSTLGVLLRHGGCDLSEPMLFGLGAGLSYIHWDREGWSLPFVGGRIKPFEIVRNLAARLGLDLVVRETSSARKAWDDVRGVIESGKPVGLQLDCYFLEYFRTPIHFGGHIVALYGFDARTAFLVESEQQGGAVSTSLESLAQARAARGPMTARHRSFTVTVPERPVPVRELFTPAIVACAKAFLNPPIGNLGHRGIAKTAKLINTWLERATRPERDLPEAALLMEKAGTGGALFRNLYRDFLAECLEFSDDDRLRAGHRLYAEAAQRWSAIAELIRRAGTSGDTRFLTDASALLGELARIEREAMTALSQLSGE